LLATSMTVPPLKSIPRFSPWSERAAIEITTTVPESANQIRRLPM